MPAIFRNMSFDVFNKIAKTKKSPLRILLDHVLASVLPLTGFAVIKFSGKSSIGGAPLLVFLPLIALSEWIGGLTAGILTSILSAVAISFYLIPSNPHFLQNLSWILQFILLTAEGIGLSYIIEVTKRQDRIKDYKIREKELKKKIDALTEQNINYEKEIRSRDEFLSIASHELKTPLTSMLLQTQTALHNIRNVSVAKFSFENLLKMLESVENQTKRLSKMINDLLAVSLITMGNLNLEYENVDLNKLISDLLTDFAARIEREHYKIKYDSHESIIGNWDKIRIEQAISNFISNALKYGDQKPIEIETKKQNGFAEFMIKDHGIGISKQNQKQIFELFQRGVSQDKYKGLGVGLYITKKIALAHGGSVDVSSSEGQGSKFTMNLPLKRPKSN